MAEQEGFYVVYEYTSKAGGLVGNRYMVHYSDEADFQEFNHAENNPKLLIAEGGSRVSESEASKLCRSVSDETLVSGAMRLSEDPDGSINPRRLEMNLANIAIANGFDERE